MSTHEAQPHGHTLPLSITRGAVIQLVGGGTIHRTQKKRACWSQELDGIRLLIPQYVAMERQLKNKTNRITEDSAVRI
ncbi:hypothetical protein BDQ94DRAFT_152142 [Aspergillus welwitschiae]|uniref:Uncharacterized protein n=1 Tax=Aspergillus welwitschiae TaxID=1341132 RepID=A0A3F3PN31_9EURO|nr:hypothetical protein BDQ94DRAFT_152142 [Aspergillus welwitschiae]RDH28324.1 hypothetical protein BDQ94DRAFT_152142 [Aspergillus welwitschiae]